MLEGPTDSQCELWAAMGGYAAHVTALTAMFHYDSIHLSTTTTVLRQTYIMLRQTYPLSSMSAVAEPCV